MMILIDGNQPMPDAELQRQADLFAIRRGDRIQIAKDRIGLIGGLVSFSEFRKIVDDRLKRMLDESSRPL